MAPLRAKVPGGAGGDTVLGARRNHTNPPGRETREQARGRGQLADFVLAGAWSL